MSTEAFQDWSSLFNENISQIWSTTERKEFKKAAMIVKVLGNEFNKILGIGGEVKIKRKTKNQLTTTDDNKPNVQVDCKCFPTIEQSVSFLGIKDNEYTTRGVQTVTINSITPVRDSIDGRHCKQDRTTPEICLAEESQEILLSHDSKFNGNIEDIGSSSDGGQTNTEIERSPRINKHRKFFRVKRLINVTPSYSILDLKRELPKTHINSSNSYNATPNRDDVIDSTIIEGTPDLSCASKKSKSVMQKTPQKSRKVLQSLRKQRVLNNSTLTQMFSNVTSSTKCNVDLNNSKHNHWDDGKLKTVEERCEETIDSERENEENHLSSRTSTKSKVNVPKIKYKTIVRGKERMLLEGWDCEECTKFYKGLDMTPNGVKALLNKCSKHRSKFKPDDYTPAGNIKYLNIIKRQ